MWITKKEYELMYVRIERLQKEKQEAISKALEYEKLIRTFLRKERKTQNYRSVQNVLNKLETEVEGIGGELWEEHNNKLY